jgi:zinc transport system substrate-binding protein
MQPGASESNFNAAGSPERKKMTGILRHPIIALAIALFFFTGCQKKALDPEKSGKSIITSDTILSGMVASLLPSGFFRVSAIMPPGQCPGHYDIKLSDIEKVKKADLVLSFRGMPFMAKAEMETGRHCVVDAKDDNWMAPKSYLAGLQIIAKELSARFPGYQSQIAERLADAMRAVTETSARLRDEIQQAGVNCEPVLASSMQKETLEWMGFRVVGTYGRPEAISAQEMIRLSRLGRESKAVAVIDNLQSGPEAGKGLAEDLHVPHVVLSNFPSAEGYLATLSENVGVMVAAVRGK